MYCVWKGAPALAAWCWLGAAGTSRRPLREFWPEYFGPQIWWHRSAQADYWLYFANALIVPAAFVFVLIDERHFGAFINSALGLPNAAAFVQGPNGGGTYNPIAGRITTLASPMRQIQFALKLIF